MIFPAMRRMLSLLSLLIFLTSCTTAPPQNPDTKADTQLGAAREEQTEEAEAALEELREVQRQEQKRHLERQITDPLVNAEKSSN